MALLLKNLPAVIPCAMQRDSAALQTRDLSHRLPDQHRIASCDDASGMTNNKSHTE